MKKRSIPTKELIKKSVLKFVNGEVPATKKKLATKKSMKLAFESMIPSIKGLVE